METYWVWNYNELIFKFCTTTEMKDQFHNPFNFNVTELNPQPSASSLGATKCGRTL